MASLPRHMTFDCADAYTLASFWSQVVERPLGDDDNPGDPAAVVELAEGPGLLFIGVPEGKTVKNRLHLDVSPIDGSTEDEVTRLLGLGATKTDVGQGSDRNWVVMADPEGNEFDVARTLAPQN